MKGPLMAAAIGGLVVALLFPWPAPAAAAAFTLACVILREQEVSRFAALVERTVRDIEERLRRPVR